MTHKPVATNDQLKRLVIAAGMTASLITGAGARAAIELENWWVRALPPTQTMTAAYGVITNTGDATVTLSDATTPTAKQVELHTTQQIDGHVRMLPMAYPSLAPGERLILEPGGPHLMLMGVDRMPALGSTVTLCVHVSTNESICTDADARRTAPKDHSHHSMHH